MIPSFVLDSLDLSKDQERIYRRVLERNVTVRPIEYPASGLWVVTAVNEKFSLSALTLLRSVGKVSGVDGVLLWDIGLKPETRKVLQEMSPTPLLICDDLLPLLTESYIKNYQFKLDGLALAPFFIPGNIQNSALIWIDSGILINGSIDECRSFLDVGEYFLCDLSTRSVGNGKTGDTVKLFNHLPGYDESRGFFPFSSSVLCKPLLWGGVHGFRIGSRYHKDVIEWAFFLSLMRRDLLIGPKFVSPDIRVRMEADEIFLAALAYADKMGIDLATRRWNGARHDMFIYGCLFYYSGFVGISSVGRIEDVTDSHQTIRTANAEGPIVAEQIFHPAILKDSSVEFVIHRATLSIPK